MRRLRTLRSRLRVWVGCAVLAVGLVGACYTPSVPLPPPLVEAMTFSAGPSPGTVVLRGPAQTGIGVVRFSVFDESQRLGVIVESAADGSFTTPPFTGNDGDYVRIFYEDAAGTLSPERCTTLHLDAGLVGSTCH